MTSDLKCLRCRYTWKRRTWNRLPRQCPNCHRNDWNKVEVGPVGRPPLKAKEVMPSEAAPIQSKSDVSGEHRAEKSTSAKPVVEPQYKHKAYGVTYGNMAPHTLTEDELNSPLYDASTEELLDHLLEQVENEETK